MYKIELIKQKSREYISEAWEREYTRDIKVFSPNSYWWNWEEHSFKVSIPRKRRILTTRLVKVTTPKHIEYRIVDIYRDRLFKCISESDNPWRVEKLIFSKGINRTLLKCSLNSISTEEERISKVKELYKGFRKSEEEIIIGSI